MSLSSGNVSFIYAGIDPLFLSGVNLRQMTSEILSLLGIQPKGMDFDTPPSEEVLSAIDEIVLFFIETGSR